MNIKFVKLDIYKILAVMLIFDVTVIECMNKREVHFVFIEKSLFLVILLHYTNVN